MQESSSVDVRDPTAYRPNADARPEGVAGDLLDAASKASAANEGGVAATWRRGYGSLWWLDLTFLGLLVFLLGAMQPLNEADLPMHLATGEWIVRHGTVPFTEPFAWTGAGAPYFAYSWSPEVLYYAIMRWSGAADLHLFQGVIFAGYRASSALLLALPLSLVPWVAQRGRFHRRERVMNSALWLVGLVAFAYEGRLLLC